MLDLLFSSITANGVNIENFLICMSSVVIAERLSQVLLKLERVEIE